MVETARPALDRGSAPKLARGWVSGLKGGSVGTKRTRLAYHSDIEAGLLARAG